MADLDDGPTQAPLPPEEVQETIARLLAGAGYDLVVTHGPAGEYTRHRRHEECCQAVVELWRRGRLDTGRLWLFAYEDGGRSYSPRVRADADRRVTLTEGVWGEKVRVLAEVYGFGPQSWEGKAVCREEGFWCFDSPQMAFQRIQALERQR